MSNDFFNCVRCGEKLKENNEELECVSCSARFPVFDGIPVFGSKDSVDSWGRYHSDPELSKRVAGGKYLSEIPSENNSYYSKYIPDDAVLVLDVGGGDGNTTSDWAERNPNSIVYVMDLSLHGLKKVKRRGLKNMVPVCAPADYRFPFQNDSFDVVSTVFMVEHLESESLNNFYREAKRVLKPGGLLIVASDTRFYDAVLHPIERLLRKGKYIRNDPTHINLMTPSECEASISREGFSVSERCIHWVAGRYEFFKKIYGFLPKKFSEGAFSTMYVITAKKINA